MFSSRHVSKQPSLGQHCSPPQHKERARKSAPNIACFTSPWPTYCGRNKKAKKYLRTSPRGTSEHLLTGTTQIDLIDAYRCWTCQVQNRHCRSQWDPSVPDHWRKLYSLDQWNNPKPNQVFDGNTWNYMTKCFSRSLKTIPRAQTTIVNLFAFFHYRRCNG